MRLAYILIFVAVGLIHFSAASQGNRQQFYELDNLQSRELIKAVSKDEKGFLWVATDNGVLRYDGYETLHFDEQLPTPFVKAFLKRKNGSFYVLFDYGIKEVVEEADTIVFKPLVIRDSVYDLSLNYPKSIYEDRDGNVWIGEVNSLVKIDNEGIRNYYLGEPFRSIDYHRTFSFAEDAFGTLWIAPFKGPLLYYDPRRDSLKSVNINPLTEVSSIASVKGDFLLIGGKEGIVKIKTDSDRNILSQEIISSVTEVSVIGAMALDRIYVGTWNSGLYCYNFELNKFEFLSDVPIHDVVNFYFDPAAEEMWLAGSESVGLFKPSIVTHIPTVGKNRIESLTVANNGELYYSIGKEIFSVTPGEGAPSQQILAADETYFDRLLAEGSQLWIGDAFGKISVFDTRSGSREFVLSSPDIAIRNIDRDSEGNKWFTGHSKGLIKVDQNKNVKFYHSMTEAVSVKGNAVGSLFCVSNGKQKLLSRYDKASDQFKEVSLKFLFDCPDNVIVNDFIFDGANNLWIATEAGLFHATLAENQTVVKRITLDDFPETEAVKAVALADGYLYIANTSGLVVYRQDGEYLMFDENSGLPSKILKERGLVLNNQGDLFIATAKGLAVVPNKAMQFKKTEKPIFKNVLVNGALKNVPGSAGLNLPYKTRLEAEFISLSYPATNTIYETRILGLEDEWSAPSTNRNLSIINFSSGNYTLQIRAREEGKLWSDPLSFTFSITKPWYRQWWAYMVFLLSGVLLLSLTATVYNNNLIRQKRKLQQLVDERTEELNRKQQELIEQQNKIIQQKEELLEKNETVYKSQQALNEADMNYLHLKEKQLQEQLEYKNKQVTTHALNIIQKNETLKQLRDRLEEIVKKPERNSVAELRKTLKIIDESFKLDKDWNDFKLYFEQVHTGFYSKLKINYPELTVQELRHCALIRLNLTIAECASVLGISHDSAKVSRTRLRKKLNLDPGQSLTDFILSL